MCLGVDETYFSKSNPNKTKYVFVNRFVDQLILCSFYGICKIKGVGFQFKEIISKFVAKSYFPKKVKHKIIHECVLHADVFFKDGSLFLKPHDTSRHSNSFPISPNEQPITEDLSFAVGDLIEFYNKDFLKKFKSKIMEFKHKKNPFADHDFKNNIPSQPMSTFINMRLDQEANFQAQRLLTRPSEFHLSNNQPTGRMLNFDDQVDDYEISTQYLNSKSKQNSQQLPNPFEFSKMAKTRSPDNHILQKFKTDLTQNISSPSDSKKKKTFEALKQEGRPKIYQAQRRRTPDSTFNSIHRSQRGSHDPNHSIEISVQREYQSHANQQKYESFSTQRSTPGTGRGQNSKYLKKTFQILHKPLTSNKTSAFSYFAKKKMSANKVGLKSKPLSTMTRMTRTTGFHERAFLGSDQKKSGGFQSILMGKKGQNLSRVRGKNLYSKANMSKYKGNNFSQNKNYKAKIEEVIFKRGSGTKDEFEHKQKRSLTEVKSKLKSNYSKTKNFDTRKNISKKIKFGMKSPKLGDSQKRKNLQKKMRMGKVKGEKKPELYQRSSHVSKREKGEETNPNRVDKMVNRNIEDKNIYKRSPNLAKYGLGQYYRKKK
jgi:hypothetical protein